jgi:hypothetical protein
MLAKAQVSKSPSWQTILSTDKASPNNNVGRVWRTNYRSSVNCQRGVLFIRRMTFVVVSLVSLALIGLMSA